MISEDNTSNCCHCFQSPVRELQLTPVRPGFMALSWILPASLRYARGLLDEDIFQGKELMDSRPLQALVAGLKACSTWGNIRCLQDCREGTGGTVEARELLAQHAKQYEERPLVGMLRGWAESGGDKLRTR
ncbi:hypothetical protein mRhiFer1_000213 [Rhinolophus ferrumequinum]|uniref:Uncharacterized protein n=1 Tax=Rhinolophus ferrumequinum TaxID=59479 RepID=A0A7J7R2K4_RHIFE|nr:hypothetical protein mRhiFer1_000213 [Rhinolophus ferrumequinum]